MDGGARERAGNPRLSVYSGADPRIPLSAVYHRVHTQWRVHVRALAGENTCLNGGYLQVRQQLWQRRSMRVQRMDGAEQQVAVGGPFGMVRSVFAFVPQAIGFDSPITFFVLFSAARPLQMHPAILGLNMLLTLREREVSTKARRRREFWMRESVGGAQAVKGFEEGMINTHTYKCGVG